MSRAIVNIADIRENWARNIHDNCKLKVIGLCFHPLIPNHARNLVLVRLTIESVYFVHADVTSWPSQINTFKAAVARSESGSSLDIVIAAAGVVCKAFMHPLDGVPSLEIDPEQPSTMAIEVNLTSSYFTTTLANYYLRPRSSSNDKSLILLLPREHTTAYLSLLIIMHRNLASGVCSRQYVNR